MNVATVVLQSTNELLERRQKDGNVTYAPYLSNQDKTDISELFDRLDVGRKGHVTIKDIHDALDYATGKHVSGESVRQVFAKMDRGRQGRIQLPDFLEYLATKLLVPECYDDTLRSEQGQLLTEVGCKLYELLKTFKRKQMLSDAMSGAQGCKRLQALAHTAPPPRARRKALLGWALAGEPSSGSVRSASPATPPGRTLRRNQSAGPALARSKSLARMASSSVIPAQPGSGGSSPASGRSPTRRCSPDPRIAGSALQRRLPFSASTSVVTTLDAVQEARGGMDGGDSRLWSSTDAFSVSMSVAGQKEVVMTFRPLGAAAAPPPAAAGARTNGQQQQAASRPASALGSSHSTILLHPTRPTSPSHAPGRRPGSSLGGVQRPASALGMASGCASPGAARGMGARPRSAMQTWPVPPQLTLWKSSQLLQEAAEATERCGQVDPHLAAVHSVQQQPELHMHVHRAPVLPAGQRRASTAGGSRPAPEQMQMSFPPRPQSAMDVVEAAQASCSPWSTGGAVGVLRPTETAAQRALAPALEPRSQLYNRASGEDAEPAPRQEVPTWALDSDPASDLGGYAQHMPGDGVAYIADPRAPGSMDGRDRSGTSAAGVGLSSSGLAEAGAEAETEGDTQGDGAGEAAGTLGCSPKQLPRYMARTPAAQALFLESKVPLDSDPILAKLPGWIRREIGLKPVPAAAPEHQHQWQDEAAGADVCDVEQDAHEAAAAAAAQAGETWLHPLVEERQNLPPRSASSGSAGGGGSAAAAMAPAGLRGTSNKLMVVQEHDGEGEGDCADHDEEAGPPQQQQAPLPSSRNRRSPSPLGLRSSVPAAGSPSGRQSPLVHFQDTDNNGDKSTDVNHCGDNDVPDAALGEVNRSSLLEWERSITASRTSVSAALQPLDGGISAVDVADADPRDGAGEEEEEELYQLLVAAAKRGPVRPRQQANPAAVPAVSPCAPAPSADMQQVECDALMHNQQQQQQQAGGPGGQAQLQLLRQQSMSRGGGGSGAGSRRASMRHVLVPEEVQLARSSAELDKLLLQELPASLKGLALDTGAPGAALSALRASRDEVGAGTGSDDDGPSTESLCAAAALAHAALWTEHYVGNAAQPAASGPPPVRLNRAAMLRLHALHGADQQGRGPERLRKHIAPAMLQQLSRQCADGWAAMAAVRPASPSHAARHQQRERYSSCSRSRSPSPNAHADLGSGAPSAAASGPDTPGSAGTHASAASQHPHAPDAGGSHTVASPGSSGSPRRRRSSGAHISTIHRLRPEAAAASTMSDHTPHHGLTVDVTPSPARTPHGHSPAHGHPAAPTSPATASPKRLHRRPATASMAPGTRSPSSAGSPYPSGGPAARPLLPHEALAANRGHRLQQAQAQQRPASAAASSGGGASALPQNPDMSVGSRPHHSSGPLSPHSPHTTGVHAHLASLQHDEDLHQHPPHHSHRHVVVPPRTAPTIRHEAVRLLGKEVVADCLRAQAPQQQQHVGLGHAWGGDVDDPGGELPSSLQQALDSQDGGGGGESRRLSGGMDSGGGTPHGGLGVAGNLASGRQGRAGTGRAPGAATDGTLRRPATAGGKQQPAFVSPAQRPGLSTVHWMLDR